MHSGSFEESQSSPHGDTGSAPKASDHAAFTQPDTSGQTGPAKAKGPASPGNPGDEPRLSRDLTAYISGDDEAGDRICRQLEPTIRAEVARFLPATDTDRDDVIQESLMAMLNHLRRTGSCPDRPAAFVATIAANRCRNLYQWRKRRKPVDIDASRELPSESDHDPLRGLEQAELKRFIRRAFQLLDAPCQALLRAIYVDDRPMEELQREAGLTTVQGVYYRKYVCLRKMSEHLNRDWFGGQSAGAKP